LAIPSAAALKASNLAFENEIAGRKSAEAELAYERDLLETLLESSPDHVYFKDRDSRFIKSSRTMGERAQGRSLAEMVGLTDFDCFTEEHARPAFEDEQWIIRTGQPILGKVEREVWKGTGKVTWALTSKVPLRNKAGEIIGTFGISKDITEIKEAEAKLDHVHKQLLETSRQAGMAEVATSVLHNVGNVLNSVNISCSVISEKVEKSRVASVAKVAELLREHEKDLAAFLAADSVGKKLPEYLGKLGTRLAEEQAAMLKEIHLLSQNIEHIKEIVVVQQSYARINGSRETLPVKDLVEDALRMNTGALERHSVEIVREYDEAPPVSMEKHRVMQILVNLVSNAKYALSECDRAEKRMNIRVARNDAHVAVSVSDNGIGISPENMTRIFAHGFTTKKNGHGFGLHSAALAAQEMGGRLDVHSDGPGAGATFTLELPINGESDHA
jgi:PAS domain S-box-containing protein